VNKHGGARFAERHGDGAADVLRRAGNDRARPASSAFISLIRSDLRQR
jgi:hypothetical protein